jgi:hypothetical protein
VPGVRFAVNVSMGLIEYPYRRFLLFSAIGGTLWATYTSLLAYWIGGALTDFPIASIVISGLITTILIAAVYWIDRRRRAGEAESRPTPETATRRESEAGAGWVGARTAPNELGLPADARGTPRLPIVDRTDTSQPCCGEWSVPKTYPHRSVSRTQYA